MMRARWLAFAFAALVAAPALAHKPSDAYLTLTRDGDALSGRLDVALRDLDNVLTLDANGDGEITWAEVRGKHADIAAYAGDRVSVSSGGVRCAMAVTDHAIDAHTDGAYAVLFLRGRCAEARQTITLDYRLLFDIDPQHRGLVQLIDGGRTSSAVMRAEAPTLNLGGDSDRVLAQFAAYLNEGVWHIWLGFDHVMFLLSLLLPSVLVRRDGRWQPGGSFHAALVDVVKIVTAFTVAHSITLSLAALDIVSLPSRWVESAIALSVVLAALNNVFPVVAQGRWIAAFAFGLLHGFGFAGALQDLGLPGGSLALSLAGFNLGVELGQLAIVAMFLPLAFALRATWGYRRLAMAGGSTVIAALALIWFAERAFDVSLMIAG